MNIRELFDKKKCVFSFEMFPPKKESADMGAMLDTVNGLKKLSPDYISITYGAGGKGGKKHGDACKRRQSRRRGAFGAHHMHGQRRV